MRPSTLSRGKNKKSVGTSGFPASSAPSPACSPGCCTKLLNAGPPMVSRWWVVMMMMTDTQSELEPKQQKKPKSCCSHRSLSAATPQDCLESVANPAHTRTHTHSHCCLQGSSSLSSDSRPTLKLWFLRVTSFFCTKVSNPEADATFTTTTAWLCRGPRHSHHLLHWLMGG